jgi:hypothetical protein
MLSIEYDPAGESVLVVGDPAGLRSLAERLRHLADRTPAGGTDHDHLMSPAWGGADLTPDPQKAGDQAVHHLKVVCWRANRGEDAEAAPAADSEA